MVGVEEQLGPKSLNLDALSESEIKGLNYKQLQAVLGRLNLPKNGKKEDLRKRLYRHYGLPTEVDADSSDESKPRQRRKWTRTDPARFAHNEYHENLFRANFPFIDVVHIPADESFPGVDKFEGEVLDRAAKGELFDQWLDRIVRTTSYYKKPLNEKQSGPKHLGLFEELGNITRVAPHEVQRLSVLLGKTWEYSAEPSQCNICRRGSMDCSCEANQGIKIQVSAEDLKNTGLQIAPEDPSMLEGDLEDPDEDTVVLSVWDDRVRKRRKLETGSSSGPTGIDTQRAVCVVERKFDDDGAPFQGGYYAVKNGMRNIQKGHLLPIYVLVLTATEWTYGKLELCGLVTLKNGQVDPASMDTFDSQQKLSGHGVYTYELLQQKLEAGTAFYRKFYKDNPTAHFRDHTTLVGTFYLKSERYALPRAELGHGLNSPDVHRLFDGLLRVIVGDSVLEWKKEDYDSVYRCRKDYIRTWRACGKQEV